MHGSIALRKEDFSIQTLPNLIIGGGIAGLWLHARALAEGKSSLLIADELGGGQTLLSQGIIHGGTKYALSGNLTGASEAIKAMPQRWLDALDGQGEIDLSDVEMASPHQLMIHNDSIGGRVTQFFASKALRGRVDAIQTPNYLPKNTKVYQLTEPVLDTHSLIQSLGRRPHIIQGTVKRVDPKTGNVELDGGQLLQAQRVVLCAGEGNESILKASGINTPAMQRRPLRMLVGHGKLPPIWAHIVGTGSKPLATITTHNGAWYIGGGIAEEGVGQDDFLTRAPKRLQQLLPSINLDNVRWEFVDINRAEPATQNAARPDHPFVSSQDRLTVAWPTKLALSPALADQVMALLSPSQGMAIEGRVPNIASTPWSADA